jgi:hypothetical protein
VSAVLCAKVSGMRPLTFQALAHGLMVVVCVECLKGRMELNFATLRCAVLW